MILPASLSHQRFSHRGRGVSSLASFSYPAPGDIATFAGDGTPCSSPPSCGDGGLALNAELNGPAGLAIGRGGSLYIADWADDEVRMIPGYPCASSCPFGLPSMVEGDIYTIAHARKVFGVALDALGNLYITDTIAETVERVARSDGQVSVVAGTGALCSSPTSPCGNRGPATSAELANPFGLVIGAHGHIYIADDGNNRIRVMTPEVALAPAEKALGDGPTVASNADICTNGDAVVCSSGDLNLSSTDFSIKGFGAGLSLARTYNSTDASESSIFGYGWTSSYSMSLHVESNGDVEVGQPGGSLVTFTPGSAPGTYTAPPYVFASLSKSPSGTFTYMVRGHSIYSFSPSGSLISISDPNGSATTLSYSPAGKLASLTDASGRSLSLSYNPSGLVSSVTDPMRRTWEYSYDPSGDLVFATNPGGGTWDFTYSPAHLLLSVTDPMGRTTRNTYNTSGQVISQVDPAGQATTYSYSGDPFSSGGGTTTITGPTGIRETQTYTLGTLTSLTRDAGTPEASTWRYTIDPAT